MALPTPPTPQVGSLVFETEFESVDTQLARVEDAVKADIRAKLAQRTSGSWPGSDDELFAAFTSFAAHCIYILTPQRATRLWLVELRPLVDEAQASAQTPIHIGSPLYNCGLCFFFAGDFDRFYQFMGAADEVTQLISTSPVNLLIGDGISETMLIDPMIAWLSSEWGSLYTAITTHPLDKNEYVDLVKWLSQRLTDSMHVIVSLHRFLLQRPPDNPATRHIRVRAVADLCIAMESSTRRWNTGTQGQLFAHASAVASTLGCGAEFDALHSAFNQQCASTGIPKESASAVNWVCAKCVGQAESAGSLEERRAATLYLAVRLRNSLLHVLEEQLDIYSDRAFLLKVACLVVSTIRLSRIASGQ